MTDNKAYTDGVHLMVFADTDLGVLHRFAKSIELKPEWFQEHPKHPHYDLTTRRMFLKAMDAGAEVLDTRTLIVICNRSQ